MSILSPLAEIYILLRCYHTDGTQMSHSVPVLSGEVAQQSGFSQKRYLTMTVK